MQIKCFPVGQYEANCYIVTDENSKQCAVIDPGDETNVIMDYIERLNLQVKYIFLTHGHFDHVMAVDGVREETGARVCMHAADNRQDVTHMFTPPEDTIWVKEGDEFTVGDMTFRVIETPGHTPGSICWKCGEALFTGDTLFCGSCGRTDLPGGDMAALMKSLQKLGRLPGEYEVYPGHMDDTTMTRERTFNYYMRYAAEMASN